MEHSCVTCDWKDYSIDNITVCPMCGESVNTLEEHESNSTEKTDVTDVDIICAAFRHTSDEGGDFRDRMAFVAGARWMREKQRSLIYDKS